MVDCKVCYNKGLHPKCLCGRICRIKKKRKTNMEKIQEAKEKERLKMNQLAYDNFHRINASGSGCQSFDDDVKETHGSW